MFDQVTHWESTDVSTRFSDAQILAHFTVESPWETISPPSKKIHWILYICRCWEPNMLMLAKYEKGASFLKLMGFDNKIWFVNHHFELVESNFVFEELFFHFYKRQYKPKGSKWIIKERRHHPCRIYWPIVFQCQYSRYEKCALMADQCRKSCESANWVIHESRGLNNQSRRNCHKRTDVRKCSPSTLSPRTSAINHTIWCSSFLYNLYR